jgi:hypothetical protein
MSENLSTVAVETRAIVEAACEEGAASVERACHAYRDGDPIAFVESVQELQTLAACNASSAAHWRACAHGLAGVVHVTHAPESDGAGWDACEHVACKVSREMLASIATIIEEVNGAAKGGAL